MRRRILFLSQCLPFPPHSGVTKRTYHVLKELQREFDITLIAFSRRDHQPDAAALDQAVAALRQELSDVMNPIRISSEFSRVSKLANHARSVVSNEPYIYYEYGDRRFGDQIEEALDRSPPDLIHLDSLDLYRWLPSLPSLPTACTHHSVESDLLRLQASHFSNPLVRAYMKHQGDLVEKVERKYCPRLALNVMTSSVDAERLRALASGAQTVVIPNGVDVDFFRPAASEQALPGRVTFLGPTYMIPNRDAVEFFLADVWPLIKQGCPESSFHLIGKNSPEDKMRFESHAGVTCNGHVPDVRPHLAEAAVSVVPIRVGGGTRLKILDAWAMGKAVVSTSVGCEGLQTIDGRNILIRDDPTEFASAVVEVLSNPDLRHQLGRAARKTAEERYAWSAVGKTLVGAYENMLERAAN